jgi:LacI family transcriptional regulator
MRTTRTAPADLIPRYIRIREAIIKRVESGDLKPGDQIPSLREMCQEYGVSSITARRALLDLLNEGIVERRGGLGAFVTGTLRRARLAVVIIGYSESSWRRDSGSFGQLVGGIASAAWEEEASLSVVPISDTTRANASLARLLRDQPIDGVLFRIAGEVDWSILEIPLTFGVEAVLIKRVAPGDSTPSVVPDAQRAGRIAVERLVRDGHQRIALVATTVSPDTYRDHRAGFEAAMRDAGLSINPDFMPSLARGTRQDGAAMTAPLLTLRKPPTAIVTNSDFLAAGVYESVAAAGLTIPRDISVVSFDDVEFAAHLAPPLTTVRLSYYDLGHAAAAALFRALRKEPGPQIEIVPVELVERESVAPPQ